MFVDSSVTRLNGKAYTRHLLRETYREDGKVKSNPGQSHPLQTGRGGGDPAGAEIQGRFGSHAGVRRRELAGVEAGSVGGGGLGSVTVGARTRRRRRPG